jgi:ubiquinone/menaquinone biosynthesis C-methylase UbiE
MEVLMAQSVCPWWLGYLLASPIRRLLQDPEKILMPYVKPNMVALDIGSAMGFFTLPLARMTSHGGRVIAVDLQEKMIASLRRRAEKAGLSAQIETRQCSETQLGIEDLAGQVDFALIFAVLHEMPDIPATLASVYRALKAGGQLLMAEPTGHVNGPQFEKTIAEAEACGFTVTASPKVRRSHARVLTKPLP